jgi:hypothetical protein
VNNFVPVVASMCCIARRKGKRADVAGGYSPKYFNAIWMPSSPCAGRRRSSNASRSSWSIQGRAAPLMKRRAGLGLRLSICRGAHAATLVGGALGDAGHQRPEVAAGPLVDINGAINGLANATGKKMERRAAALYGPARQLHGGRISTCFMEPAACTTPGST